MRPFFLMIKTDLGKTYEVADKIAELEIASEIYSIAGEYDLLVKFYLDQEQDIGRYMSEMFQKVSGIRETNTIITHHVF
jgi:DNA-binding Lrp family transcriptional regulator